ncbi:MAG TPA: alpha/beta fold hydrolase [Actinomycetota bacterium]|nr:alpha/beta fold hydrolase [Actinomycetota bacterium]
MADDAGLRHAVVDTGDVSLHYVERGAGPLVVLLHGFPDFWYSWSPQLRPLADAGFRVAAPDMRGYNLSDKPRGVHAYRLDALADDVAGFVHALGEERAHVVGHDWGGIVAWRVAHRHAEVVERVVVVNAPHPSAVPRAFLSPTQLARSWYALFFQLPVLPERVVAARRFAFVRRVLRAGACSPHAFTDEDVERYVEAAARGDDLRHAIDYYRALTRANPLRPFGLDARVDAPALVIWGERDIALEKRLARPDPALVPGARVEMLPDAGHWPHRDDPDRVNELLIEFLSA